MIQVTGQEEVSSNEMQQSIQGNIEGETGEEAVMEVQDTVTQNVNQS